MIINCLSLADILADILTTVAKVAKLIVRRYRDPHDFPIIIS